MRGLRQRHVVVASIHHRRHSDLAQVLAAIDRVAADEETSANRRDDGSQHDRDAYDDEQLDQREAFANGMMIFQWEME